MTASAKKAGRRHYNTGFNSSPKLAVKAHKLIRTKMSLREESIKENKSDEIIKKLEEKKKKEIKELREAQKMSKELREEHLDLLAERRATDWNLTKPQAAAVIKEAEMSRKMHKKHQYFVKYQEKGSVKNILVPCPRSEWIPQPTDITEQKCQIRVDNPIDVFNILLRQNFNHLMKSKFSPFVKGDLQEKLGKDADKKYADSILQGLDKEKIKRDFQNNSPIFHNFIQALQIPTTILHV